MTVPNKDYSLTNVEYLLLAHWFTDGVPGEYIPGWTVDDLALVAGLDEMVRGEITYAITHWKTNLTPDHDHMSLNWGILPNQPNTYNLIEVAAGESSAGTMYLKSFIPGTSTYLNRYQELLVANGLFMKMADIDPYAPNQDGEYIYYYANMLSLKIFFLNPIVNSLSRLWAPPAGGVEVVLTGLGFNNEDSELDMGGPPRGAAWGDEVDVIDFIPLLGQGAGSFSDDFDDDIRDPKWTDDLNNGTIVESGELLTIGVANGVDAGWGAGNSPYAMITPEDDEVIFETKLNSYTVNDDTGAGLYIHDHIDPTGGISFTRFRNETTPVNGIMVWRVGVGQLAYAAVTTLPIWLRIVTTGIKVGATLKFYYSTNGTDWILLYTDASETWDIIALYVTNWGVKNAISAPFEYVDYSYKYGLTPAATLKESDGDFTVDSNSQITIPAEKFPALPAGTYEINLKKLNVDLDGATTVAGYAGDWACDSDGRVTASTRISFLISEAYISRQFRERKAPLILSDWHLEDRSDGSEVMKYYAMDYIRCPDRVYKGNLAAISSIPRGFEGKTGLFKISDLTLDLANNDLEFSKLLTGNTILKNKIVKIYQAYPDEPFGWRSHVISLLIDDYSFEGDIFRVKMRDITQKYFRSEIPRQICTADHEINDTDNYSNIHPDSRGASVPEVLGLCSLTVGEFRGQVEAICIDTLKFKYVAANGALKEITEVYSDDPVAVDPGNYSVSTEADGRTYITFTSDQKDNKVTFNCKGYIYGGLNSDNGYIQNPAYIILYLLIAILSIPSTLIDFSSFDEVAAIYDTMGEDEAGKLILQDKQDPMDVLQDLLAGAKCYLAKDGRITLGKKSISNYATNNSVAAPVIFRQLDSIEKAVREYNMRDAINTITAEYDYIPTWDVFKSSISQKADVWIGPWEAKPIIIEDDIISGTVGRKPTRRHLRAWMRTQ